jgi:hypothetical protein
MAAIEAFASAIWHFQQNIAQSYEHLFKYVIPFAQSEDLNWRRFQVRVEDLVSQDNADDCYFTWDIVNYTGGQLDPTWTSADYGSATDAIGGYINAVNSRIATKYRFSEVKAYVMAFNPAWPGSLPTAKVSPFLPSGQPDYTRVIGTNGADSSGALPPQVACSVTEIVPRRANWGRQYLPGAARSQVDASSGRWSNAFSGTVSASLHDAYLALQNIELYPTVPTAAVDHQRVAALQNITNVRCDDVPDTIRRRRFRHALYIDTRPSISMQTQPA